MSGSLPVSLRTKTLRTMHVRDLKGKRVIVRADFDVPYRNGRILDTMRIQAVLPTLRFLLARGASVRIVSHLGRPHGRRMSSLSLRNVAYVIRRSLRQHIIFLEDPFSPAALKLYSDSPALIFFENVRFWPGEEKNSKQFAVGIARWGDIYINEAFANSHRAHASMVALPALLPCRLGLYLEQELLHLSRLFTHPARPFVAALGGAKLETKVPLIRRMLAHADHVIVAGALANTLFAGQGLSIGKSLADRTPSHAWLKKLLCSPKLVLPSDVVVTPVLHGGKARVRVVNHEHVRRNEYIVDAGSASLATFALLLKKAKTVVWNGPLGYIEAPRFTRGTREFAKTLPRTRGSFTVVGGGDTLAALHSPSLLAGVTHVSTGGGAMLAFLAGEKLPGVEALKKSKIQMSNVK
ncbi:MAG: phosphoglycerate kinase [Candidatus Sungbacteria bacterium]|nr:phosphoglycerate kinase [Candidatus Sungbacteria bacterium]